MLHYSSKCKGEKMKKCFVYHRVSSDQQLDGSGMARQAELLQNYIVQSNVMADMDDPEPVIITESGGVSAFKGHNMLISSGLGSWMEEVRSGMWDGSVLIIESIDRFSRQNPYVVMGYLSDLSNHNVAIHDVMARIVINRQNSMMLPMVMMNAQRAFEESKYKSNRISTGWKKRREQAFNKGTIVTNKRPQWIDVENDQYVLNHKAAVVREIFRLYQTGMGTPTIAQHLQALEKENSDWKFNRDWTGESVHKVLKNRRVTGSIFISEIIRNFDDIENPVVQKKYEVDVYPVVISKEEFELVQELLRSRRPGAGKGRIRTNENGERHKSNLFSGIVRCCCGQAMFHNIVRSYRKPAKSEPFTEEYRYLRCLVERDKLCDNKPLNYDVVERVVIEHIKGLDFSHIAHAQEHNVEHDLVRIQIQNEAAHIEEYEQGIAKYKAEGKKVSFDMLSELEDARERMEVLQARAASFQKVKVDMDFLQNIDYSQIYDVTNVELRNRAENEIAKVIKKIVLRRTGKYYTITLEYVQDDIHTHVLFVKEDKKSGSSLVSGVLIERVSDTTAYSTPSFTIIVRENSPRIHLTDEPLSIVDYSLLLNYLDASDGHDSLAIWMRHNQNFLFMTP